MSDDEYTFLNSKRPSVKNLSAMKHSTPQTNLYRSNLATLEESAEEANYEFTYGEINTKLSPLQVANSSKVTTTTISRILSSFSSKLSPILASRESEEDQDADEKSFTATKELHAAKGEEKCVQVIPGDTACLEASYSQTTRKKTFKRKSKKHLLAVKEKVKCWEIRQLNNIEEATLHNLEFE